MDQIIIRGARTHNLKNFDLEIPRDQLVVITGLSGSGKSSLAFDTLYAEGQRRYVESLSTYARQFLESMDKPDVDHIEGLSPAIAIEQKTGSHNPRSTVGTVTEIYDYLRLLYARAGTPYCPDHGVPLDAQTISQMVDRILERDEGQRLLLLSPVVADQKGEHKPLLARLQNDGYLRVWIDGEIFELDSLPILDPKKKHRIEVVVDRFKVRPELRLRLAESLETAIEMSSGIAVIREMDTPDQYERFSANFACPECGYSLPELEPRIFSFNNPHGACETCNGLGVDEFFDPSRIISQPGLSIADGAIRGWDRKNAYYHAMMTSLGRHRGFSTEVPYEDLDKHIHELILQGSGDEEIPFQYISDKGARYTRSHRFEGVIPNMQRRYRETESSAVREELSKYLTRRPCPDCKGSRLNEASRNVRIESTNLPELTALPIEDALTFFDQLRISGRKGEVAAKVIDEIKQRLGFLNNVGLGYLNLSRSANTLSGGESQRIRLASQIGAGLVGVMYVLDEPSIGLHQRDNDRLIKTLFHLRDLGNTVLVVEHDEDAILAADHVIDIGPGAGIHGGSIVASGAPTAIMNTEESLTGCYLRGEEAVSAKSPRLPPQPGSEIIVRGAVGNNLKGETVSIPIGLLTCVTGVSGSGKSTLINETLYKHAAAALNKANARAARFEEISGLNHFDKVIDIDQSPIGRTPRSNPATYTGLFTTIRELFAGTQEARSRGYKPGRFSFNVKGGRCEACQGDGLVKVEMHFLPDVYVPCDICKGKRYNRETLDIRYKGKNIHDVLELSVEEALSFFSAVPALKSKLDMLNDVGLSYIHLGQAATTLSGGEAQRIKLAKELSRRSNGKTLYILDEPTTGLHFHDVQQLLNILFRLRDQGNTLVVIEHNLDVIRNADWIIDLGPEGGDRGGRIVAVGTPDVVAECSDSHTGVYLAKHLTRSR